MTLKYIVAAIIIALLLVGGGIWVVGRVLGKPHLQSLGNRLLGVWIVADVVGIILAFALGWFK